MKTIECFLQGKKIDDRLNEDGLFLSEHLVAVIDGVSMGTWNIWHGDTGGLFAKNVLMNFLEEETAKSEEILRKREEEAAILTAMEEAGEPEAESESEESEEEAEVKEPEEIPIWEMTPADFFHALNAALRKKAEICLEAQQEKVHKYGVWLALFSWFPVVGDLTVLALGFYKVPRGWTFLLLLVGKAIRYLFWNVIVGLF